MTAKTPKSTARCLTVAARSKVALRMSQRIASRKAHMASATALQCKNDMWRT